MSSSKVHRRFSCPQKYAQFSKMHFFATQKWVQCSVQFCTKEVPRASVSCSKDFKTPEQSKIKHVLFYLSLLSPQLAVTLVKSYKSCNWRFLFGTSANSFHNWLFSLWNVKQNCENCHKSSEILSSNVKIKDGRKAEALFVWLNRFKTPAG